MTSSLDFLRGFRVGELGKAWIVIQGGSFSSHGNFFLPRCHLDRPLLSNVTCACDSSCHPDPKPIAQRPAGLLLSASSLPFLSRFPDKSYRFYVSVYTSSI